MTNATSLREEIAAEMALVPSPMEATLMVNDERHRVLNAEEGLSHGERLDRMQQITRDTRQRQSEIRAYRRLLNDANDALVALDMNTFWRVRSA